MQHRWHSPFRVRSTLLRGFGLLCSLGLIFVATVPGQTRPLLVSEATSTRAIALESITFTREPFPLTSLISWRPDARTRIILFAMNLRLQPGEELGSVSADAEDGGHRHYPLGVESVEPVPGHRWISAVRLRLNDQMGDLGDVLVRVQFRGMPSNRVRVAIDSRGGGPLDDPGSGPTPVPPPHLISGRITDEGSPVPGATVSLSGDASAVTITDSAGNYSFLVPPTGDYLLSSSHEDYTFAPPNYSFLQINGQGQADFVSTAFHGPLRGRITNEQGQGVFRIKVDLRGTQTGTTFTGPDGRYSFSVPQVGNYLLIPSKAGGYHAFAPQSVTINGRRGSRRADFAATLNTSSTPSHVLEFDGGPKTVDFSMPLLEDPNLFWPDGIEYGHFFWEFWAMPGQNASGTYLISDGYGGAHALLFGVLNFGNIPGRYLLGGNIWNGSNPTDFVSDEGPAANEWAHLAVGWDGANITTYLNGVPVGKTPYVGPRITPGSGHGSGRLLIGGSDHQNFIGRIAQVRGFENSNPREAIGGSVFATFKPQTVFSLDGNLLSYFFRPSSDIVDLSLSGQYGRQHNGLVRSTAIGIVAECVGCPLPQFVVDPTAPDFAHPNQPGQPPAPVDIPASVPTGALIFDSFSRRNSTYALGGSGGLGSSEGGSLGPKTWQTNEAGAGPQPFGILNGHGVLLANAAALAWVNTGSVDADFDIRTDRLPRSSGSGLNTGISFRVLDSNNYFFAYSSDSPNGSPGQTLTVGHYAAGQRTVLSSGVSLGTGWTTMRVVTTGAGAVRVYADDTLLYSTNISLLAQSLGMGLYNNGPGLGLTNRWDNFRAFVAPP